MSDVSVITEEMRGLIGMETGRTVHEIDKTMLRRLAEAVDDPNPRWHEEAPPAFLMSLAVSGVGDPPARLFPLTRVVDGGGDWECYLPVRLGDVITCATGLAELYEREGRAGKLLFIVTETTVTNRDGQLVARGRATVINY